jgi:hypothetical protein
VSSGDLSLIDLFVAARDDVEDLTRNVSFDTAVERQPPCPRATTTLAGFQAAEVGVSFNVSG